MVIVFCIFTLENYIALLPSVKKPLTSVCDHIYPACLDIWEAIDLQGNSGQKSLGEFHVDLKSAKC